MQSLLLFFIRLYQLSFSYFLGRECRFLPTCSDYAKEAILQHGARSGGVLTIRRILRCRPFGDSGYDPVPEKFEN